MNSLILYGNPGFTFNADDVFQKLQDIPGVYNLERGSFVGAILQCEYKFAGDRTIARLSTDLATITVEGTGDASWQIALELQRRETQPLFVTDFGNDYNISLQGLRTIEAIRKNMFVADNAAVA